MAARHSHARQDPVRAGLIGMMVFLLGSQVLDHGWRALLHMSTWVVVFGTMLVFVLVWMAGIALITAGRPNRTKDPTA